MRRYTCAQANFSLFSGRVRVVVIAVVMTMILHFLVPMIVSLRLGFKNGGLESWLLCLFSLLRPKRRKFPKYITHFSIFQLG